MIKNKAYKFRIYPNNAQKVLLAKTFGCVRVIWNNYVNEFNSYSEEYKPTYKTPKELKQEFEWLGEVNQATLQQKSRDFEQTKKQYFNKDRKKPIGRMKFKSKHEKQSFRLPNQKFRIDENKIHLEKIGDVKCIFDRIIPEGVKFISITISKNKANEYYASICVEEEIKPKRKTNKYVGIDVGLKTYSTQSDGITISNPRFFREKQSEIKKAQKILSRKIKGSKRYSKQKLRIARIYSKISKQRNFFLHNYSTQLVNNYDVIVIEDLNVQGMMSRCKAKLGEDGKFLPNGQSRKKGLNKSIQDASFGLFFSMLKYKCEWYGKELIQIGRFEPSSKTCSNCGWINKEQTLADRVFICKECENEMDRDLNASKNILRVGVVALETSHGDDVRLSSESYCL